MLNKQFMSGMKTLVLVLGITALSACASSGRFVTLEEPLKADGKNAVIIFFGRSFTKAQVWDGEKPIGTFDGTPISTMNCLFWKTTLGAHTFVGRSTNYVHKKMTLQANKTYYIQVIDLPSPVPFTNLIAIKEVTKQEYDEAMDQWKKLGNKLLLMEYDNKWREEFLAEDNGKWLKDIKDYLKTAK